MNFLTPIDFTINHSYHKLKPRGACFSAKIVFICTFLSYITTNGIYLLMFSIFFHLTGATFVLVVC